MNLRELNTKAIEILKSNIYLTLATTDGSLPWAAPVFYCLDDQMNFYFISQPDSLHIAHIRKNPWVAFAIFDSHQPEGQGNGVQGSGRVILLEGDELEKGLRHYSTSIIALTPDNLREPATYRLFQLIPDHFYILDPEAETDKRVEIKLI